MSSGFVVLGDDGVPLLLRGAPGAKSTGFQGSYHDEASKLRGAPPVGRKADAEAARFVSVPVGASSCCGARVVGGVAGRYGTVFVGGVDEARVLGALSARPS